MASCVFSLLFLIFLFPTIAAANPTGLKVRVTDKAQNVLKDVGLAFVEEVVNRPLPDFPWKWGLLSATIKRLTITHLHADPGQMVLRFQKNSGLHFSIRNLHFNVELERSIAVHILWTKFKVDTRRVVFGGEGVSATIGVNPYRNGNGRLNVAIPYCHIRADHIHMRHSGILGPIWDLLRPLAHYLFNTRLCSAIQRIILPNINTMLAGVSTTLKLHDGYYIDYSLSGDIRTTFFSLDVPFRGLVFRQGVTMDIKSIKTGTEPVFKENYRMAYVGISEFVFNSAAMSLYRSGPLKLQIPQIDPSTNRVLETVGLPVGPVKVKLTKPPIVSIRQSGLTVYVNARAQSLVKQRLTPLPVICQVDLKVNIKGKHLDLLSKDAKCKVQPQTFGGKLVAPLVNIGLNRKITDDLMRYFDEGLVVPLPKGVFLTQGNIDYQNGFLVIGGNLKLTPAGRKNVVRGFGKKTEL
ncbi:phospholipid transfer protein-like [Lates japonicus]